MNLRRRRGLRLLIMTLSDFLGVWRRLRKEKSRDMLAMLLLVVISTWFCLSGEVVVGVVEFAATADCTEITAVFLYLFVNVLLMTWMNAKCKV